MKKSTQGIIIAFITLFLTDPIRADGPQGWHGELMPYFWYAGLEGELKVNGNTYEFDKSASDLVDAVDSAGSLMAAIQYNRFVLWGQGDYFSMSTDELDRKDQPERVELDTKMTIMEAAVGYQVDGWADGQTFDILLGGRTTHIENDLQVKGGNKFSKERNLADPMVFVRPSIPIFPSKTKKLRFNPTLGLGGGGDSESVYELFPQIQYHFTEHLAARIGYRRIGWKFEKKNNDLDVDLAGLVIGLGGTF